MRKTNRVTFYIFTLAAVLGGLLLLTGSTSIYLSNKSIAQLGQIKNEALVPVQEMDAITLELTSVRMNIRKMNNPELYGETDKSQGKILGDSLEKVSKLINDQETKSIGRVYNGQFITWLKAWKGYENQLREQIKNPSLIRKDVNAYLDPLKVIAKNLTKINETITHDAEAKFAEANASSSKARAILGALMFLGIFIGAVTSFIIMKNVNKLFAMIAEAHKNTETLLNNLDQGFFVFGKEGKIQPGVSKAAKEFYGSDPTEKNFAEVFPFNEKEEEDAKLWHNMVYGGLLSFNELEPLAPKSFEHKGKYFEVNFRPIFEAGNQRSVHKIICITSDKTEERKLREKAEAESTLVKVVMTFLSDRGAFVNFVSETRKTIVDIGRELEKQNPNIDFIFRSMHSLKGAAGTFGMLKVSREAHKFESMLEDVRVEGHERMVELTPSFKAGLAHLNHLFEKFLKDNENIFGNISGEDNRMKTIPVSTINDLCTMIHKQSGKESQVYSAFLEKIVLEDLGATFQRYESVISGIAERQLKKVKLKIEMGKVRAYTDPYQALSNVYIHAFRNAIDHGIESEEERVQAGKPETGVIQVKFAKVKSANGQDRVRIFIQDDGKGVDAKLVREKAVMKGLINETDAQKLSDKECIQLLFRSGFTTSEQVTDISGRGVGLDAIMYEATKIGGTAWIESESGKGTTLVVEVPVYESPALLAA